MVSMSPDVILNLPDDDDGTRSSKVLAHALELVTLIWENEDKRVEHRPGYEVDVTVNAAVELSGALQHLDMLIRGGYPSPRPGDRPLDRCRYGLSVALNGGGPGPWSKVHAWIGSLTFCCAALVWFWPLWRCFSCSPSACGYAALAVPTLTATEPAG